MGFENGIFLVQAGGLSGTIRGGGYVVSDFIAHQVIPDFLKLSRRSPHWLVPSMAVPWRWLIPPEQSDVIRPLPHEKLRQE